MDAIVVLPVEMWKKVTSVLDHDLFFDNTDIREIANAIEDQIEGQD